MKEKCIIYGGAGFIGSHIADELLEQDMDVTIFDKVNASRRNVLHVLDRIKFIEGDFNNRIDINNSLRKHDFAIHLVSSTLPADSNLNPVYDIESNLVSTINFLEECVRQGVRKVAFISSGGTVYGEPSKLPITEEHNTNPSCSYGIIKLTIEKYFALYKKLKNLNYTVLRFSNPFGERQNPLLSQGLITHLLYRIKKKQTIEIWGDGNVIRDFFYIKDGAKAVCLSLLDESGVSTFNISSGIGFSINQILDKFRNVLGLEFNVEYQPPRKLDVQSNVLDNSLALKILGWKPQTEFDEALRKTWSYVIDYK